MELAVADARAAIYLHSVGSGTPHAPAESQAPPLDAIALDAALARVTPAEARAWAAMACEEAVSVWQRIAPSLTLDYRDRVVGATHRVDGWLPRRALMFLIRAEGDGAALAGEYVEPVTALRDGDWSLPELAAYAFCACYNALEGRYAYAILQARDATAAELREDPARFHAVWARWWQRCRALAPPATSSGRLEGRVGCERFQDVARALYRELTVPVGEGTVETRRLPAVEFGVESVTSTRWSDGTHSAELVRTLDQPLAFQSRDRSFDIWIDVPELRTRVHIAGMDDIDGFTLTGDGVELPRVRAALEAAVASLEPLAERTLAWVCLAQRGFEALDVRLPDTTEAALVALGRAVTSALAPGFDPTGERRVLVQGRHEDVGYGEYTVTTEVLFGDDRLGFRLQTVSSESTDGAGPSCSERRSTLEAIGLPEDHAFVLSVVDRPVPFRDAGLTVNATLRGPFARLAPAESLLHRVFREGQVSAAKS